MQPPLKVYNSLTRTKEVFEPLNPPFVGLYICGPTVYGHGHLGHARSAISFDVVRRFLLHQGYKVRYVRNVTDVGHLVADADEGEDKIARKAKVEQLEPMEIAQNYTLSYHEDMERLNNLPPSIEPRATGHIVEQIEMVQAILKRGLAYEVNGSVYFDVAKYNEQNDYGKLSGRKVEDLQGGNRELDGQQEKRSPLDFALWKKASNEHIMRWNSPWGEGFPGWHLECSAMSTKYLGEKFDIHAGGMDLQFPHHECEIAQCKASNGHDPAKYWLHNNMVTVNGQKMGKSLGNSISLKEMFAGKHPLLEQAYSPMTIRFFILQSHYRSTLDFSNDALKAAEKGYKKLMNGLRNLRGMQYPTEGLTGAEPNPKTVDQINKLCHNVYVAMADDFNTALALAHLFNMLKKINSLHTGQLAFEQVGQETFEKLKQTYTAYIEEVLGLFIEPSATEEGLLQVLLEQYKHAKEAKDYDRVDGIRAALKAQGIVVKDMKTSIEWAYEE